MFDSAKNFMTGKAVQLYVNSRIARYAELRELKIDPQKKTIDLVCALHGETEPLTVRVDQYEIQQKDGRSYVRIVKCTCSRPWVQHLVEDFAVGRPLELPPLALAAL